MSIVIDRHGNPKKVPSGYVLQSGESLQIPLLMRDSPSDRGPRIMIHDGAPAPVVGPDGAWPQAVFDSAGVPYSEPPRPASGFTQDEASFPKDLPPPNFGDAAPAEWDGVISKLVGERNGGGRR